MKAIAIFLFFALGVFAAEIPKAPVPPSPYLPIIYKFADAMLERGRATNGLFHSALDRVTLAPLTNRPLAPDGLLEENRELTSANAQHDQNFLRLLYTLSELSGKPKYREAADAELRWFVEKADTRSYLSHRPWMLWERCFAIAPRASESAVRALVDEVDNSARHAGFRIRAWAVAYAHTKDEVFLAAIARAFARFEGRGHGLSFAIDCDAAARLVPESLASKLSPLAARTDDGFCLLPHFEGDNAGFAGDRLDMGSQRWIPGKWPLITIARTGMECVARYENTGDVRYRDLIHRAADVYLDSLPNEGTDAWPITFGHAISLQVAAWRSTAQQVYLDRARALADFAVKHFFDQGPLPRASLKSNHYEAITGADTLALGLVELHLHILAITAVRYPPNTIDR
jgi:hypothetical protein